jgi:hypothetical protein
VESTSSAPATGLLFAQAALPGLPQQFRQLGDIRRDPPRLVAGEPLGRRCNAVKSTFLELASALRLRMLNKFPTASVCYFQRAVLATAHP